jgi:hypothetical protein
MVLSSYCRSLIATTMLFVMSASSGGNEATVPDIRVELSNQKPLWLRVTIHSRADAPITFFKWRLPWGNRHSMILVAVTPDGKCLQQFYPIDDPGFEKISLDPGASVSGDINLRNFFTDLDSAVNKSDVHLFWAYEAPEELTIARRSGGWILIHQHH